MKYMYVLLYMKCIYILQPIWFLKGPQINLIHILTNQF